MRRASAIAVLLAAALSIPLAVLAESEVRGAVVFLLPMDGIYDGDFFPVVSLLRERGVAVTLASVTGGRSGTMDGTSVAVDMTFSGLDVAAFDAIVIPGGVGAYGMIREPIVLDLLRAAADAGVILAGICAGGDVLIQLGFADGREVANPPERAGYPPRYGAIATNEPAWTSAPFEETYVLITAIGLAHAVDDFAMHILAALAEE